MRAAILSGPRSIQLASLEPDAPGEADVVLSVEQCGICASDIDLWLGRGYEPLPVALGHEVAGEVMVAGPAVQHFKVGDRVAAWVEGGGLADQITVPERYCVSVDSRVTYPAVAEPLSCIINAVELAAPRLGDDVVIIGGGYMGNLLQLVSRLKGARSISVIDVRDEALRRAHELGADRIVNSTSRSAAAILAELGCPEGADVTYEVTGAQGGLDLAGGLTRMGGKLAIIGYHLGAERTVPMGSWNWLGFQLINAHFRDRETIMRGMRAGMRLVNSGRLEVGRLVSDTVPLERVADAFELANARRDGFVKAVVVP